MKAAGRRRLLWVFVLMLFLTGIPTGIVYATSTQEKLNQAQEDKKETHCTSCAVCFFVQE